MTKYKPRYYSKNIRKQKLPQRVRQPEVLLENILVGVEGVGLPLVKSISSIEVGLNYVNGKNRKNEYDSYNDSEDEEGSLTVRCLVLTVECIRTACDRA